MDDIIIGEEVNLGLVEVFPDEDLLNSSDEIVQSFRAERGAGDIDQEYERVLRRGFLVNATLHKRLLISTEHVVRRLYHLDVVGVGFVLAHEPVLPAA